MQELIESKASLITTKQEKQSLITTLIKLRLCENSLFAAMPEDIHRHMSAVIKQLPEFDLLDELTAKFSEICDSYQKDYKLIKNHYHELAGEVKEILRLNNANDDRKKGLIYFSALVIELVEYLDDKSRLYKMTISFLEKYYQCGYDQYWYYNAREGFHDTNLLEGSKEVALHSPINTFLVNTVLHHKSLCIETIRAYYRERQFTEDKRKSILNLMESTYNQYTTSPPSDLGMNEGDPSATKFLTLKPMLDKELESHLANTTMVQTYQSKIGHGL